jgi:hypothetical protein
LKARIAHVLELRQPLGKLRGDDGDVGGGYRGGATGVGVFGLCLGRRHEQGENQKATIHPRQYLRNKGTKQPSQQLAR